MNMYRETAIIDEKNFFKDMPSLSELRNMEDSFEQHWEIPAEIGNGFMYMTKFKSGLMLGIGDYQLFEDLSIGFEFDISSLFIIGFQLPANRWGTPGNRQGKEDFFFNSGQSLIAYAPGWQGIAEYTAGIPIRTVGIYIDPLLLNTLIDGQRNHLPTIMNEIMKGDNDKNCHYRLTTTPMVNSAIHEIINCPYQGTLRRLYFESKALELITHSLAQLVDGENGHNASPKLQSGDIKRIREARDVLICNLENPPSLFELARQVGINKNKLNQNFRQVFGTSVFDYLHIHRLEQARELLKSKEKNVTEVAFEVGYSQQSNFTRAFKKHFGTNPIDHRYG